MAFYLDVDPEVQGTITYKLAAVHGHQAGDIQRALQRINPEVNTETQTVAWEGFCMVIGFVIADLELSAEDLHNVQINCRSKFEQYNAGEVLP